MSWVSRKLSFPLLGKELVEHAARRRTYIVRVVYALLMFGFFLAFAWQYFARFAGQRGQRGLLAGLGSGREMFQMIVMLQFAGIYVFLPALMSSSITHEKERDSLVLLFLTDLSPKEVLFQKYISGLIPMFSFMLLSLPLAAIAYSFGGISTFDLVSGVSMLFLCALQVGAMAIMFSAYCRTTVSAFLCSYLFGVMFFFLLPLLGGWAIEFLRGNYYFGASDRYFITCMTPPAVFVTSEADNYYPSERLSASSFLLVRGLPIVFSIVVFLLLARSFLVRRAFAPPRQYLLKIFRRLDDLFKNWNKLVGGVTFGKEKSTLPGNDPVTWRELTKKPMGRVRYLVRLLAPIEIVIFWFGGLSVALDGGYSDPVAHFPIFMLVLWVLAIVVLSVQGANAIVSERVQQTLEVLLTTPLTGREIVHQKTSVIRRLILMSWIPFFTVVGLEYWLRATWAATERSDPTLYFVCSFLSILIYLPLISWVSLWIGLKIRTRFRAILTALGVIVVWCVAPFLTLALIEATGRSDVSQTLRTIVLLLGPTDVGVLNEVSELRQFATNELSISPWVLIILNFLFYGIVVLFIRYLCLSRAEKYLRRA